MKQCSLSLRAFFESPKSAFAPCDVYSRTVEEKKNTDPGISYNSASEERRQQRDSSATTTSKKLRSSTAQHKWATKRRAAKSNSSKIGHRPQLHQERRARVSTDNQPRTSILHSSRPRSPFTDAAKHSLLCACTPHLRGQLLSPVRAKLRARPASVSFKSRGPGGTRRSG